MHRLLRRYWILFPVLASLATQCDETPRGAIPTMVTSAEVVLTSVPAAVPKDPVGSAAVQDCLRRMNSQNHVRPSWEMNVVVPLAQVAPNVWAVTFNFVPIGFTNTMTVHDTNECARNPSGDGRVTIGVTVNGTMVDRVVGGNSTLAFEISADGLVTLPRAPSPPPR